MKEATVKYLISQLGYQTPQLLIYLVAGVLAILYLRRAYVPSLLTIAGVAMLGIVTFTRVVMNVYLIESTDHQLKWMSVVQIFLLLVNTVGLASLVAAIFVGRQSPSSAR